MTVYDRFSCSKCAHKGHLDIDFTMAFQPIVDVHSNRIFAYEALVRGLAEETAFSVISKIKDDQLYLFDQLCRVKAITLASQLNIDSMLSINFLPNAVYVPERCIRTTLDVAKECDFSVEKILFEFTENQEVKDPGHLKELLDYYHAVGFKTAIDDFGAGFAGLGLLADFQPNIVKIDMALVRNIDKNEARQVIVTNSLNMFKDLNITPIAEGIETKEEASWLKNAGVKLLQGFYFAKPGFECLPEVDFSQIDI